jgi:hypothetical protein
MEAMDEAKQAALETLKAGLENGDSPMTILNDISSVWDGDPMELINMLV